MSYHVGRIYYTAYKFQEPSLGRLDYERMSRLTKAQYRRHVKELLKPEWQLFRSEHIGELKVVGFGIIVALFVIAIEALWPDDWTVTRVYLERGASWIMIPVSIVSLAYLLSYTLSLLSFFSYILEKRGFYLRHKRKLDKRMRGKKLGRNDLLPSSVLADINKLRSSRFRSPRQNDY